MKNAHGITYYVGVVNIITGGYEEHMKTTCYEDAFDRWNKLSSSCNGDNYEIWLTSDTGMKKVR